MKRVKKTARKLAIGLIGFPLLGLGIVLIPLPGPGLLISFLALFLLSLEFDWADNYLQKARRKFDEIYKTAKKRADKVENWGNKKDKK